MDHLRSGDQDQLDQHSETPTLLKIQKIRWCVPVIPATQEAEAGELPEPRRWRLQSSLAPGDRSRLCLRKKKESLKAGN